MATFYEDSTRRVVFDERARRFAPLDGPEKCQVDLLEWSAGTNYFPHSVIPAAFRMLTQILGDNITTPPLIETNAQALRTRDRPRVQIVYEKHFRLATLANSIFFQDLRLWMLPTTNLELAFKLYLTTIAFLQISYLNV